MRGVGWVCVCLMGSEHEHGLPKGCASILGTDVYGCCPCRHSNVSRLLVSSIFSSAAKIKHLLGKISPGCVVKEHFPAWRYKFHWRYKKHLAELGRGAHLT